MTRSPLRSIPLAPRGVSAAYLAAGLLLLGGCHGGSGKASLPPAAAAARGVRVAPPATRLDTGLARATGSIRAKEDATLAPKGTGQIRRIRVSVGDRVRAGTPLVEMDSAQAAIALDNARAAERLAAANLAAAEKEFARAGSLFEQGSLPQAGWDRVLAARDIAQAQLDQARAAVRATQQALSDTTVVAPFDGVVTAKYRNAGDTVTLMPVTPILALTDLDHLEVRLAVPESIEAFVKPGQAVTGVTTPGGRPFEARVRMKGSVVDPSTRTIEVLADVGRMPGEPLRPGTLVTVDFGGFADHDGLFIPASAVRTEGKETSVMVVAGGRAERRIVEILPINPGTVAVVSGLDAGASLILDPGALAPGDPVVPLAR
jgi:RND family efflux transporter MFP subunit